MAGPLQQLCDELHIQASDIRFEFIGKQKREEYLTSRKTIFFNEMCATLNIAYREKYAGLKRIYPKSDDIIIASYDERTKAYKSFNEKHRSLNRWQKLSAFISRSLMSSDRVWFLYPLEGNFCRVYVANFVARNIPFLLRCAKLCAACWLFYNEKYYGYGNSEGKVGNMQNIPDIELAKNSYLILINLGMGAWLKKNLETVVIKEKEELKKTLGRMQEISGDLERLKWEITSFEGKPNKREVCELLFAHIAHVNSYLIGILDSQEAVVCEEREIITESGRMGNKKKVNFLDKNKTVVEEHKKLLENIEAPLQQIAKNLANPDFPVKESIKEFRLVWSLTDLSKRIEEIAKEKSYEIYELRSLCFGFHSVVHNELGYLNKGIRTELKLSDEK